MSSAKQRLKEALISAGFDEVGITTAEPLPEAGRRFANWLANGRAGEMDYLAKSAGTRSDPRRLLPGARSVVMAVAAYLPRQSRSSPVADYACSIDYHLRFQAALEQGVSVIKEIDPGADCRIAVDSSPLFERALAHRAGLGWIGCSANLITPRFGPFILLGAIVTTLALEPDAPWVEGSCGNCRLCLERCPTGALLAPGQIDASRCVSYLTIEKKGPFRSRESRAIGVCAFGCDQCTRACIQGLSLSPSHCSPLLTPREDLAVANLYDLLSLCEGGFKRAFKDTAFFRTGKSRLIRNILYAARNLDLDWVPTRARAHLEGGTSASREAARAVLQEND